MQYEVLTPAVGPHSEHGGQDVRPQGSLWRILHQSSCVSPDRNCVQWVRLLWYRGTPNRIAVAQGPNNQIKLEAGAFIIALSGKASKVIAQLCLLTGSCTPSACLLGEQSYREGLDAVQTLLKTVWCQCWVRHRPKTQHSTGCHEKGNTWSLHPWKHSGWAATGLTAGLTSFNSSLQKVSGFSR